MFSIRAFFFTFTLAVAVLAQSGQTDNTPPCILNCIVTGAADANCPVTMDDASYNCVCTSTTFENSTSTCLHKFCTSDEIQVASAMQTKKCTAAAMNAAKAPANGTNSANSTAGSLAGQTSVASSLFGEGHSALPIFGAFVVGLLFFHA
ncbi:hypothetical protein BJ912DRAFT_997099 [Pholiota molesta]|nr:hypothetical protein BJ912DRAFT_997099 [Pholiota molesta]